MKPLVVAALALVCTAGPGAAQEPFEPELSFTIGVGMVAGSGHLWSLPKQATLAPSGFDTVGIARVLRPGLAAALGAVYQTSPHLGIFGEIGYFGTASEMRCTPPAAGWQPDVEQKNEQGCAGAQGQHVETSVVGFQGGLLYRFASGGRVQPYARASAGLGLLGSSFIRTSALVQYASCTTVCEIVFAEGESTPDLAFLGSLAVGASLEMSPGYRFRFEARDLIVQLPVPTAPADPFTVLAPVGLTLRHIPVFTVGLDVVFQRRRGRRY